jgi:ribosome assembly protein RRB1
MQVWDLSSGLNSLAESATPSPKEDDIIHRQTPVKVFSGHKAEGYAIDWSPLVTGRLVSGVYMILHISQYLSSTVMFKMFP